MARSYFNNIPFWDLTTQSDLIKAPNHGFIVYMGIRVHFLLDLGVWVLKAFCNQYFVVLHKANSYKLFKITFFIFERLDVKLKSNIVNNL